MHMRFRLLTVATMLATLTALGGFARAQGSAFRCVDASGQVSYQQVACPPEAEQRTVRVMDALPTLTPEEQFRAEAQRLGLSPGEYAKRLEASGQVWTTEGAQESAELDAQTLPQQVPCLRDDGGVYFTRRGTCPSLPASPNTGIDFEPQAARSPAAELRGSPALQENPRQLGSGTLRPDEDGCEQARRTAREARDADLGLSYAERSRLDEQVRRACRER